VPNAPILDLSAIPAAQRAVVQALLEEVAALKDITRREEHLIAGWNHALHGKRSEKLSEDERQLVFEDLSIALAEVEAEKDLRAAKASAAATKPAPRRTIGNLPAALPRIEEFIEPASLFCPCGCGVMHKIGEDRTEHRKRHVRTVVSAFRIFGHAVLQTSFAGGSLWRSRMSTG